MRIMRLNWTCYHGDIHKSLVRFLIAENKQLIPYIILNFVLNILWFFNLINAKVYYTTRWHPYFNLSKQQKNKFYLLVSKKLNEDLGNVCVVDEVPLEIMDAVFTNAHCYGIAFDEKNKALPYIETSILEKIKEEELKSKDDSSSFLEIEGYTKNIYNNKQKRHCYLHSFGVLFGLSFILLIITLINTSVVISIRLFLSYLKDIPLLLLNIFPIYTAMILCYMLSKRIWVSFGITGILSFVLSMINFYKLKFRNDPFVISDILLINESKNMAGEYSLEPRYYHILMGIFILYVIYCCYKHYREKLHMTIRLRCMIVLATFLVSTGISTGVVFNEFVYERVGDVNAIESRWSATQQYQQRGFLYPFMYSFTYSLDKEPENYNETKAESTISKFKDGTIAEDKKINIIAIMLEAYTDLSINSNLEFNIDPYDYLHRLQTESFNGNLLVDIFGGGTIATERSFLTGFMNQPNYLKQTDSYVSHLKEQGYNTYAFHPCYGWFYNRQNINYKLGFQEFHYVENYFEKITYDNSLFDTLIEHYEDTTAMSEKPYFNFTVTYQGHGPYAGIDIGNPEFIANKDTYVEEDYYTINNYLAQIYNTNQNIDRLIETLRDDNEATIVVLFGDHKPMLGEDMSGYKAIDMDVSLNTINGWEEYYKVPYLIWGNKASKELTAKELVGDGPTISPNYLMMKVFDLLGWQGNSYMQYLRTIYKDIPIMNSTYMEVGGEYKNSVEYKDSEKYKNYRDVEYYQSHQ